MSTKGSFIFHEIQIGKESIWCVALVLLCYCVSKIAPQTWQFNGDPRPEHIPIWIACFVSWLHRLSGTKRCGIELEMQINMNNRDPILSLMLSIGFQGVFSVWRTWMTCPNTSILICVMCLTFQTITKSIGIYSKCTKTLKCNFWKLLGRGVD